MPVEDRDSGEQRGSGQGPAPRSLVYRQACLPLAGEALSSFGDIGLNTYLGTPLWRQLACDRIPVLTTRVKIMN